MGLASSAPEEALAAEAARLAGPFGGFARRCLRQSPADRPAFAEIVAELRQMGEFMDPAIEKYAAKFVGGRAAGVPEPFRLDEIDRAVQATVVVARLTTGVMGMTPIVDDVNDPAVHMSALMRRFVPLAFDRKEFRKRFSGYDIACSRSPRACGQKPRPPEFRVTCPSGDGGKWIILIKPEDMRTPITVSLCPPYTVGRSSTA
jgi:hypothetical protein